MGYQVCLPTAGADNRGNGIENLTCMAFSGTSHAEVVAAGGQNNILLLNVDRGTIVKQVCHTRVSLIVGTDYRMVH
jgi:hypothetical protein